MLDIRLPPVTFVPADTARTTQSLLLTSKVSVPTAHAAVITRPQLMERLETACLPKVTLIAAPAGFGKTTLLATWAQHQPSPIAWLALEHAENDPTRFWMYLLTAIERAYPGSAAPALTILQSGQESTEIMLAALLNTLATAPKPITLVLDDCHVITAPPIYQALAFLIDHLPPQVHLLLISRADPPLPLARLRARGELAELRAEQLRFSADESAKLLNQRMGLALSEADLAELNARTEGWVAGLHLTALALQSQTDRSNFITALRGSDRFILDYLVDEVLAQQPADIQQFLLQTSVLDRLSGALCDAVTGRTDSQDMLEALDHANLFIVPLDRERQWYRYQHLFADCLRARLHRIAPEQEASLHQRAADWYAAHELIASPNISSAAVLEVKHAPQQNTISAPVAADVEPLSEREREVLRLIAAGLSNQQVAQSLIVSLSTVKTHLINIYGKLRVHSRTQAVARAQELRLA